MVSFELGKEIKKDVNSSCHEREKILSRILTQNLEEEEETLIVHICT